MLNALCVCENIKKIKKNVFLLFLRQVLHTLAQMNLKSL